jgi:hypothetical protein
VNDPLGALLFLFGVGFLGANLAILYEWLQDFGRRRQAILVWRLPPPRFAWLSVAVAVALAFLIVYKLIVLRWIVWRLFGEAMMLTYYGYLYPLSLRTKRGFYESGVRLDRGFIRWQDISGLTWREGPPLVLVAACSRRQRAGLLTVPAARFGAVRRVLRDRIAAHEIHYTHPPLDLGGHDEREDV